MRFIYRSGTIHFLCLFWFLVVLTFVAKYGSSYNDLMTAHVTQLHVTILTR